MVNNMDSLQKNTPTELLIHDAQKYPRNVLNTIILSHKFVLVTEIWAQYIVIRCLINNHVYNRMAIG
jgi:hypothetical protein